MNIEEKVNLANEIFKSIVKSESFSRVSERFSEGEVPRIILSGVGKNWYICEKIVKTYLSMGIQSEALDCVHALHGDLGMLMTGERKLLVFLSKSGTTTEMVKLAKVVRELVGKGIIKNLYVVGFFMNDDKHIDTDLYDDVILLPEGYNYLDIPEFDARNIVPSLSINTMQMVLDVLGVNIYEAHQELVDAYVYNHLGGANGKRLLSGDLVKALN